MTELDMATVRSHAAHCGLNLLSTARAEANDRWWLSSGNYFVTTDPGKSLAEIDAVLDEIDGGEWARQRAEREAARAEQEALRERLLAGQADRDASEGQDEDEDSSPAADEDIAS